MLKMIEEPVLVDQSRFTTANKLRFFIIHPSGARVEYKTDVKLRVTVDHFDTVNYKKFLWFKFSKKFRRGDFYTVTVDCRFDFYGSEEMFYYALFTPVYVDETDELNRVQDNDANRVFRLPQQWFHTKFTVHRPSDIPEDVAVRMAIDDVLSMAQRYIIETGERQGVEIRV